MRHFTAYHGISGRRFVMKKILFVCHGSRDWQQPTCKRIAATCGIVGHLG